MAVIARKNNWFKDPESLKEFNNIVDNWNQHNAGTQTWDRMIARGTSTNDDAATGIIGEYVTGYASDVTFPTSGHYGDATSISLTAGDWDISLVYEYKPNGASHSGDTIIGVSTTTGDSGTGLVPGDTRVSFTVANSAWNYSGAIPSIRKSFSATTTVYVKYYDLYAAATPHLYARISARRVR